MAGQVRVAVDRAQGLAVLGQEERPQQQRQHGRGHVVGILAGLREMADALQLGRAEPGQVRFPDGDDPDQRQVLQQPPAEEVLAGDRPGGSPVAAVLDHLTEDVLGAEQAEKAGVRGRDQDGSLPGAAGAPDVVPEHVRIDHDRRRAQQDVARERTTWIRETDGRDRIVLVHVSDHAADKARNILRGIRIRSPRTLRLLKAAAQATD